MLIEIKKLEEMVYESYEVMYYVNVLKSHGIDTQLDVTIENEKVKVSLHSLHMNQLYLKDKGILNIPNIHNYGYRIECVDIFQLTKPSRSALRNSAINGDFLPDSSTFESVIDNIYELALADVIIQQQKMTNEFKQAANANLRYLKEAIEKFCEYENKSKLSLKW